MTYPETKNGVFFVFGTFEKVTRLDELELIRCKCVERTLAEHIGPNPKRGQFWLLLNQATIAAKEHAEKTAVSVHEFEYIVRTAANLVIDIWYTLRPNLQFDPNEATSEELLELEEDRLWDIQNVWLHKDELLNNLTPIPQIDHRFGDITG